MTCAKYNDFDGLELKIKMIDIVTEGQKGFLVTQNTKHLGLKPAFKFKVPDEVIDQILNPVSEEANDDSGK